MFIKDLSAASITICTTDTQIAELLKFIDSRELLSFDLETNGTDYRKDSIVGFGISSGLSGFYVPVLRYDVDSKMLHPVVERNTVNLILSKLNGKKCLAWNGAFETNFCSSNFSFDFLPCFYADPMLMFHTADENRYNYGLKENAEAELGKWATAPQQAMFESIKANGGSDKEYYKASVEALGTYCVWDCILTEWFYQKYIKVLEKEDTKDFFFKEVMELYKHVTIPMETNGIKLDMPKILKAQFEIIQDLEALNEKIQAVIKPNLDEFETWFLNKDYPPSRSGAFAQGIAEFYNLDLPKTASGAYSLAKKGIEALPDSLAKSVLLEQAYMPKEDVVQIQKLLWSKTGDRYMFNLLSKHHLKKLFFDKLQETPLSRTEKGNPQVDDDFLQVMAKKYSWVSDLTIFNRLTKLKGTYIDRLIEKSIDGRFYPTFKQHATISGRYGGDLQQLPRPVEDGSEPEIILKYNNQIREFFIADDGYIFVDDDYESAEPRTFAHISGDQSIKDIFLNGEDFYSKIAILVLGLNDVSADKKAPNYLGKLNKSLRQQAKAFSLGIPYGMSGYKLSFEIGVSVEQADELVKKYLSAFPALREWMQRTEQSVKMYGKVKAETGRVRHFPRAVTLYQRHGERVLDSLSLWKDYHHAPELYEGMKKIRRELRNYIANGNNFQIQSRVASMMNLACIAIAKEFKAKNLDAKIVAQIHDELIVHCKEDIKHVVGEIIQRNMESAAPCSVPMIAIPSYGKNFKEAKGV